MKISAIIPAYNEEKSIENAILSLKNQDFPKDEFEIIIVNDGSTDRTREIAEKYAHKVITQKNQGPAFAKNNGAKKAKGDIIVFMDADTTVSSNYFKEIMKAVKRENVIGGQPNIKFKNEGIYRELTQNLVGNIIPHILDKLEIYKICLRTTCCFYKKDYFLKEGGFEDFTFDDAEFSFRVGRKGKLTILRNVNSYTSSRKIDKFGNIKSIYYSLKIPKWIGEFQRTGKEPESLARLKYFEMR